MQYFGSNIVGGVAESWVEAEMSWVEVDGAGWSWVHGLVIPVLICRYGEVQSNRVYVLNYSAKLLT